MDFQQLNLDIRYTIKVHYITGLIGSLLVYFWWKICPNSLCGRPARISI